MFVMSAPQTLPRPTIVPLGDSALLVRFGTTLTDTANAAAIAFAHMLDTFPISGVVEVVPNLISVMLRYDPHRTEPAVIAGEIRVRMGRTAQNINGARRWTIPAVFDGPDLDELATSLAMSVADFIAAHNASTLRVLATGFAPGFVYCGLHPEGLIVPRRAGVRPAVPPGSILFAAGQTAITATEMPTGWHVIGRTDFANFDPLADPPTRLAAGDIVEFAA